MLCILFSRAREDLRTCNQRINTMLADYGDVVPRREFEMMETTCHVSVASRHQIKKFYFNIFIEYGNRY